MSIIIITIIIITVLILSDRTLKSSDQLILSLHTHTHLQTPPLPPPSLTPSLTLRFMTFHFKDIRLCHSSWPSSQRWMTPRRMTVRQKSLRRMAQTVGADMVGVLCQNCVWF